MSVHITTVAKNDAKIPTVVALLAIPLALACFSFSLVSNGHLSLRRLGRAIPPRTNTHTPPSHNDVVSQPTTSHPVSIPSSILPLPLPPRDFPQGCHMVGFDKQSALAWSFNTRAFCLTAAVCIRPATSAANAHMYTSDDPTKTSCVADHPSLKPLNPQPNPHLNCTTLREDEVLCAHGKYRKYSSPDCPAQGSISGLKAAERNTLDWQDDDELAIIVPAMPYLRNIYHFAYIAASIDQLLDRLPFLQQQWMRSLLSQAQQNSRPTLRNTMLHIVFRNLEPAQLGRWQSAIFAAIRRRHNATYRNIRVSALHEEPSGGQISAKNLNRATCFRRAVLLDARREINIWPFANGSALSTTGDRVPAAAVVFRRAVYSAFNISSRLPRHLPLSDNSRIKFELPPRVLLYARRQTLPDPLPGATLPRGMTRRFSQTDEAWFRGMLFNESGKHGFSMVEFTATHHDDIGMQIGRFARAGIVAGIHGANLVNGMFVAPFGGLVEMFPGRTNNRSIPCYIAGANSGLAYAAHEAEFATASESGCRIDDKTCWKHLRGRLVKIRSRRQRRLVRATVRRVLSRLVWLHEWFPTGIPARYDATVGEFVIDYNK